MIKKLTDVLDYGFFAELSLAIFAAVFIAIVIRTLMMRQDLAEQSARIVLNDNEESNE